MGIITHVNRCKMGGFLKDRAFLRVQRMASADPMLLTMLDFIRSEAAIAALIAASERGMPAVTGISEQLRTRISEKSLRAASVKQFVGLAVRAVLRAEGYEPDKVGVRVRHDPLFQAGTVYAKAAMPAPTSDRDLIERILASLSADEIRAAIPFLQSRLAELESKKTNHL
jgi:hypothetical protein